MKQNLVVISLVFLFLIVIGGCLKEALDFSYVEHYVEDFTGENSQIRLHSQSSNLNRYQFPQTWNIGQFLSTSIQKEMPLPQIIHFDQQIQFIKQKTAQYLKLSNKAELLVKNIKQLPAMRDNPDFVVKKEEFAAIEMQENKLKQLNDEINNKGVQLEKMIRQLMIQQENPIFKQEELNFEKKALTKKIDLLNQLLTEASSEETSEKRKTNQDKVNDYFKELNNIFVSQNGLIESIDTLLKNHNELTILKARVTSLSSQLKAHELTYSQKQQCNTEFQKIKDKQLHDRQVYKLIQTLKQKKHQFNQPNKYCSGVENKLIDRIKKLLIGYDYVYECAFELEHVRENRDRVRKELEEAQRKLTQLQQSRGVQEFRKFFQSNRAVIAKKIHQLKTLQLDQFYKYPNSIVSSINEAERKIAQIDHNLENLPSKSISNLNEIQNLIKQKVNQIQNLKQQYCQVNQFYNHNAALIQNKIVKMQQQQEYNSWIGKLQVEKVQQLQKIKSTMKEIEYEILEFLI